MRTDAWDRGHGSRVGKPSAARRRRSLPGCRPNSSRRPQLQQEDQSRQPDFAAMQRCLRREREPLGRQHHVLGYRYRPAVQRGANSIAGSRFYSEAAMPPAAVQNHRVADCQRGNVLGRGWQSELVASGQSEGGRDLQCKPPHPEAGVTG